MAPRDEQRVEVGGRDLRVTNLDKVLYPDTGTTKADVMAYLQSVADVLVPLAAGRPVTRKRWVDGVGEAARPGAVFFQKDLESSAPDWVPRRTLAHSDHDNVYPVLDARDGRATLAWFAQVAALELHVPQWRFDAAGRPGPPDRLVLDLDPGEGAGLAECVEVAGLLRRILDGMDLPTVPVTSGSKGIHLYARLDGSTDSDAATAIARELARALEADRPELVVSSIRKAERRGKVLVDWSQNRASKTTIAPYSLRGRARPTVAMPRTWRELRSPSLRQVELGEVAAILRRRGDAAAALVPEGVDRLAVYRGMRDAARTPEPVPAGPPAGSDGSAFVIQDHRASRRHFDFRLERDGVLVSWAVPKGVPGPGERDRLAVHVEDHPLEYAGFEGEIPEGEYGAGTVRIWDRGEYSAAKWRDDEIIVTLRGRPDGGLGGEPVTLALIRTDRGDGDDWLLHRMAAPPRERAVPAPEGRPARDRYRPMLAVLGDPARPPAGDVVVEGKWDGWRAIATVSDGRATLRSRNDRDLTADHPELAAIAEAVGGRDAVLDGEIVALDPRGRPDFARLQRRLRDGAAGIPTAYFAFDLLALDGVDLARRPQRERRALLEAVVREGDAVAVPPPFGDDPAEGLAQARRLGIEGVLVKDRGAPYAPGTRSDAWVKLKLDADQEVVVVGWRPGRGRRAGGVGSLLVAVPGPDGGLRYAGRVGTGFTDRDLDRLGATLAARARKTPPVAGVPDEDARDARWVRADLVGEVRLAGWTDAGRLRHPVWRGLRPDRAPDDLAPPGTHVARVPTMP